VSPRGLALGAYVLVAFYLLLVFTLQSVPPRIVALLGGARDDLASTIRHRHGDARARRVGRRAGQARLPTYVIRDKPELDGFSVANATL
jgi:hypothetical protein